MFYRIAESADWLGAQETGEFASADLAAEGFIHGSELPQVLRTANKYYLGKAGLVLLEIDESRLIVPVVREDLSGSGILFPHSYAPIPLAAVVRHFRFDESDTGGFSLPAELSS